MSGDARNLSIRSRLRRLRLLRRAPRWEPGEPFASAVTASLVTPLNLFFLHELVQRLGRLEIPGDIIECGVYQGGSAAILGWSMAQLDGQRKLWLFDSFAGMPPAGERDGEYSHQLEGKFVGSLAGTRELLERVGVPDERYEIVPGFYADVLPSFEPPTVALLHVDCDFYEPVRLVLEKFYPAVSEGGFVVLNDYGIYKGARAATDEFMDALGLTLAPVPIDPTAAFFQKPGPRFAEPVPVAGHYPGWPGAVA